MELYQQGDVLIKSAEKLPTKVKKIGHNHLAEGEATGHYHAAIADDVELFEDTNGVLWMSAPSGTPVEHQEHKTINVPPGVYKIDIVQEYDHFAEEVRRVVD